MATSEFLTDMLNLVQKHKHLHPDTKIELLQIAIRDYKARQEETNNAMRKHKIFYFNSTLN